MNKAQLVREQYSKRLRSPKLSTSIMRNLKVATHKDSLKDLRRKAQLENPPTKINKPNQAQNPNQKVSKYNLAQQKGDPLKFRVSHLQSLSNRRRKAIKNQL